MSSSDAHDAPGKLTFFGKISSKMGRKSPDKLHHFPECVGENLITSVKSLTFTG